MAGTATHSLGASGPVQHPLRLQSRQQCLNALYRCQAQSIVNQSLVIGIPIGKTKLKLESAYPDGGDDALDRWGAPARLPASDDGLARVESSRKLRLRDPRSTACFADNASTDHGSNL